MPADLLARKDGAAPAFRDLRDRVQADIFAGLPEHFRRMGWSRDQLADWQRDRLRRLLAAAMRRSAFHAGRLRGIDPARFELAGLPSLPVMTKTQMMDHFDELISDRRLTREAAERALAAMTFAMVAASSAVHGNRLRAVDAGRHPGQVRPRAGHPAGRRDRRPTQPIAGRRPVRLPQHAGQAGRRQEAGRLTIAPRLVQSTAEALQPEFRTAISQAFGAPIYNTFATSEGLVGSSGPDEPAITMGTDSCIVEPVDAAGRPVPPGTASAKVLVTNLYNHLQPLIRYELSDSFTRHPDDPSHGHLRVSVEGRADPILRYGQAEIHPLALRSVLLDTPEVLDYQVQQTARGVAVSVLLQRETSLAPLREQLRNALARAGLADPDVTLDSVAALPRHAQTGKLRRVIPA
jgi:phenylacetate-CoA ligase